MKVSVVAQGEVSRTLAIEVPPESVAREYERVYARVARTAAIPGFRKGKVPRGILEPQVRASVHQQVLESLLPQATRDAVERESLRAVGQPAIEDLRYDGQGPISFKAVIEVKPDFALGRIEGLELAAPAEEVADAEVEHELEGLRQRVATPGEPTAAGAAPGDWIKMDFQGFIEGRPFSGGQASDYTMVLGRGQLIPGFEDQLAGACAGETRQVKVEFPGDYPSAEVAGKPAEFLVTLKEVRALALPAVDDAFARTVGPDLADLAALKGRLREAVGAAKRAARRRVLMEGAADALVRAHGFALPQSLVDAEARALEQGELGRMAGRGLELNGEEGRAALSKALREPAERRARLALVLERIAQDRGLEVTDADFEAEVGRLAGQMRAGAAETAAYIRRTGREPGVRDQIRERKALEWVVDKAKVKAAA